MVAESARPTGNGSYTCANCHQTFDKAWSDEEAAAEALDVFGTIPEKEQEVVCDDCYQAMMSWGERTGAIEAERERLARVGRTPEDPHDCGFVGGTY